MHYRPVGALIAVAGGLLLGGAISPEGAAAEGCLGLGQLKKIDASELKRLDLDGTLCGHRSADERGKAGDRSEGVLGLASGLLQTVGVTERSDKVTERSDKPKAEQRKSAQANWSETGTSTTTTGPSGSRTRSATTSEPSSASTIGPSTSTSKKQAQPAADTAKTESSNKRAQPANDAKAAPLLGGLLGEVAPVLTPATEVLETTTGTLTQTAEPVLAVTETVTAIAEPVAAVTEPVLALAEPVTALVEPVLAVAEPVVRIVEPVTAVLQPVASAVESVVPLVESTLETVTTTTGLHLPVVAEVLGIIDQTVEDVVVPLATDPLALTEVSTLTNAPVLLPLETLVSGPVAEIAQSTLLQTAADGPQVSASTEQDTAGWQPITSGAGNAEPAVDGGTITAEPKAGDTRTNEGGSNEQAPSPQPAAPVSSATSSAPSTGQSSAPFAVFMSIAALATLFTARRLFEETAVLKAVSYAPAPFPPR